MGDYQTYSGLNPRNLFQLGMAASEEGLFTLSFEYFELALQELDPSEKYYKATHRYILEMMNDTAQVVCQATYIYSLKIFYQDG